MDAFEIQEVREETLRMASDYLHRKYGITNRAAGDLRRLAELEGQGQSALGPSKLADDKQGERP